MMLAKRVRLFGAAAAMAMAVLVAPATAQDIAESHMKAAREAIDAINATDDFDGILPQAAQALKAELIQKNPDLVELINATVDKNALALATRRADLEREAAIAYAEVFSEEDLNAIAEFYRSPAGQKLLADGPIVTREVFQAAEIWKNGIARDLAQNVGEQIQAAVNAQAPEEPAEATEGGAAN